MADLDGGFFLMEKGVPSEAQDVNGTMQRVGPFDLSVGVFIEPPSEVIAQGEDAVGAWLAFLFGSCGADARKLGGAARFHVQIGPASD